MSFDEEMAIKLHLRLTRKQVEFLMGAASDYHSKMWNNGKPLPGWNFAMELLNSLREQQPNCAALTYSE